MSASLNILINLSQSTESGWENKNIKENVTISDDNQLVLKKLIQGADYSEIDKKYIIQMFLGSLDEIQGNGKESLGINSQEDADFSDIEFF